MMVVCMFEKSSGNRSSHSLRKVDPTIAKAMKSVVICQTDEGLSAQFGLSYNTWRKIRSGLPVRRSLAERVELRVSQLMALDRPATNRHPANNNESRAGRGRDIDDDQRRFERSAARELVGDTDF